MRRSLLLLIVISLGLLGGGCGTSSSSSSTGSGALATELSYFPAGSPFVASIATNPQGSAVQNAQGLLGAFSLSRLGIAALQSQLGAIGLSYQTDIKPLFGNPIAFGVLHVPGAASISGSGLLAVWVTGSASKLDALIKKLPGLTAIGKAGGATLYRAGSSITIAVDGATVVLGGSTADVEAALTRHARGGGITAAEFDSAMGNLPRHTLIRAFGSLSGSLTTPRAAAARKIPWVGAIRSYAVAISAGSTGFTAQFRIDTSGGSLTGADLPLSSGTAAPSLAGTLPIIVGVRDPSQSFNFIVSALQAADPTAYAQFVKGENAVKSKTGIDLQTFASLLTGNMIIASDGHTTMARADVSNPASAAKELAQLPRFVHAMHARHAVRRVSGGFYSIQESGGKSLNLGLVGNQFVVGVATPAQLQAFATAPTAPASTHGALAFRISLVDLVRTVAKTPPSAIIQSILSSLGSITGSASADPHALTGSLSLGVK